MACVCLGCVYYLHTLSSQCNAFLGIASSAAPGASDAEASLPAAPAVLASLDAAVTTLQRDVLWASLAVDRVGICALITGSIMLNLGATQAAVACYEWIIKNDKRIARERSVPFK